MGPPGTLRDALVAGLTLDAVNRHADNVVMANMAQLVNTIHSLFLAHQDRFIVTPNYHLFAMYAPHQGATAVRTVFSAPRVSMTRQDRAVALWGLAGSASIRDKTLTVTVANPHALAPRQCAIATSGAGVRTVGDDLVVHGPARPQQFRAAERAVADDSGGRSTRQATGAHIPGCVGHAPARHTRMIVAVTTDPVWRII